MNAAGTQIDLQSPLLARLADRTARVAVVGLGYVGLPLALTFSRKGGLRALGNAARQSYTHGRPSSLAEAHQRPRHTPGQNTNQL